MFVHDLLLGLHDHFLGLSVAETRRRRVREGLVRVLVHDVVLDVGHVHSCARR